MEAIVPILIPALFLTMIVLERVAPGRPLPAVRRWALKGTVFFVLAMVMNALIPAVVVTAVGTRAPLHLRTLGTVGGALVAFLASDLLNYWIHRTMHRVPRLWRWTHQMHHSAERVDMLGAVYFHPFDFAIQIAPGAALVALLGVSPDAAALGGLMGFVWAVFQHLNVRTPAWLGYVIQRPEAHSVHHQRGVHAYNYGNVPVWDLLFGTFRNPQGFVEQAGFWDGASARTGAMLLGHDVSEPGGTDAAQGGARPALGGVSASAAVR